MKDTVEGKPEKAPHVPSEYGHANVYRDWAAMQSFYGPRIAIPPYYNSPLPSGQSHTYIWGHPQSLMPPLRAPYTAMHPHGGLYCHPSAPTQKLKSLDASDDEASEKATSGRKKISQSLETDTSTDRTDGKRSRDGSPVLGLCGSRKSLKSPDQERNTNTAKLNERERRKQSNRESARRSRLRKRAETEELGRKVDSLTAANIALRCEINILVEKSEKLRAENSTLTEKLKPCKPEEEVSTRNLLSKVDETSASDGGIGEEVVVYERKYKAGTELRQLLGPVAAR